MGRRPKPKSDDFFERTPSVIEVIAILCLKPLNNCSTVWEHYPWAKDYFDRAPAPGILTNTYGRPVCFAASRRLQAGFKLASHGFAHGPTPLFCTHV